MIGRLSGTLIDNQAPSILVDVQGVGYECLAPMNTIYRLPDLGQAVVLHTHLSISENAHSLYAFYTLDERKLFREVIKISGVGPKLALAILSAMTVDEFVHNIHAGEPQALVKIPGVGKKTAERLMIEMKDKLKDWDATDANVAVDSTLANSQSYNQQVQEAISALVALGYKPQMASKAISKIEQQDLSSAQLIRQALKNM